MGIAGFVASLVGILTCGLASPIGLILSLIGLGKEPKGLAIAGTVIGGAGSLLFLVMGLSFLAGIAVGLLEEVDPPDEAWLGFAAQAIVVRAGLTGELPSVDEGHELIAEFEDSWGNALRYEPSGDDFTIRSAGPDGLFDTSDDIVSSGENPRAR